MPNRKTVLIVAGIVLAAGAAAAVSAPWERGHHGGDMMRGDRGGGPMHGMRRWFRGPVTQETFDADLRARFARLDKNNDGFIDSSEIEARMGRRAGRHQRHGGRRSQHMLRRFDADRDGKVTRDEYLSGVRARFARFDLNNDGRITDDDLPPMLRGRGALSDDQARGPRRGFGRRILRFVRDADADKDGAVTLDEVVARAEARFSRFDRTGDNTLDKADADALRKEMTDYRVKRFVHRFGADAEGKVSREQFLAKGKERFARLDQNNDGTISRDEWPGRHGKRGWHGRHGWHHRGEHHRGNRDRDRDQPAMNEDADTGQSGSESDGAAAKDSK